MRTDELIGALARDASPVRRLAAPGRRTLFWLSGATLFAAANVYAMGLRQDISAKLSDVPFVVEVTAAVATGILAAYAAFSSGVPGRPKWERWLPVVPLLVWLASMGNGCWQSWMKLGPEGLVFKPDLICFPYIALAASLPSVLIFWMIRRAAPLAPTVTASLAALAAAALAAAALRFFHAQDASLMVLVWQFGSVVVLALLGALLGRSFVRWPRHTVVPMGR